MNPSANRIIPEMPARLLKYLFSRFSGRVKSTPVLVLMPHSRCNCKCVMCDIWLANRKSQELTAEDLQHHIESLQRLGVRWVVLSGGEPLMHSNLWGFCRLLKETNVRITLLSTGLLLKENARDICEFCSEVVVSLDGSSDVHNSIRRVPEAYERMAEGIRALRLVDPKFRITARCVLQRQNYSDLFNIVQAAQALRLDQISFLSADVTSNAFNRPSPWPESRVSEIALGPEEVDHFRTLIEKLIVVHSGDIRSGFIAESAEKLRRLPAYYSAHHGVGAFPVNRCNAPWISAVVEADGTVRPCFFHQALGNIREHPLEAILNNPKAIRFRNQLDVRRDPICRRCVCTLHMSPRAELQ